jgi:aspartate-semialdehyde dehydrogenase
MPDDKTFKNNTEINDTCYAIANTYYIADYNIAYENIAAGRIFNVTDAPVNPGTIDLAWKQIRKYNDGSWLELKLYLIYDYGKIKRIVMSSYQAASGAGAKAMAELEQQVRDWAAGKELKVEKFQYQLLFNLIPHIDVFTENGYTKEEMKVINETKKIMHAPEMQITCTTVRVPVLRAHSESINIETEKNITVEKARELLSKAPGVKLEDDPANKKYPMPLFAAGKDEIFVGRIRQDFSKENCLNLWVSGDQIRKGVALNAVQIAEIIVKEGLK